MNKMFLFVALSLAGSGLIPMAEARTSPLPDGIKVVMSNLGPVFTDAKGMTLYTWMFDAKPNVSECNDDKPTQGHAFNSTFVYPLPPAPARRTCAQKSPPFLAKSETLAEQSDWSVFRRKDGRLQWAFRSKPLYTSIKDTRPGEINNATGAWMPAAAPLDNVPPGVKSKVSKHGVVLALANGKTIYVLSSGTIDNAMCDEECARAWEPLSAPVTQWRNDDWYTDAGDGGEPQWYYRGKRVYTNVHDFDPGDFEGLKGGGGQLIVLKSPPGLPKEIMSTPFKGRSILTDRSGRTLYIFSCSEETSPRVSCDDPGDAPIYRSSYCHDACKNVFVPVVAPPKARPIDDTWSVVIFDPEDPLAQQVGRKKAMSVWAFRGRPVFTYSRDIAPGDTNGALGVIGTSRWSMIFDDGDGDH